MGKPLLEDILVKLHVLTFHFLNFNIFPVKKTNQSKLINILILNYDSYHFICFYLRVIPSNKGEIHHGICECEHAVWSVVGMPEPSRLACVEGELFEEETECGRWCTCLGGQINCKPRCSLFQLPPHLNCSLVPSPEDPCCSMPDCQMNLPEHGVLESQEPTQLTQIEPNEELEMNATHEPTSLPDEKNFVSNESMILTDESNDALNTDVVMKEDAGHLTANIEKHIINDTEQIQYNNKTSVREEKHSSSEGLQKQFTSLNDLLSKHKQLGSFPLNTTTTKTIELMDGSNKGDEMDDAHIETPEMNLEAPPHQHSDSLMTTMMSKHNAMMNMADQDHSDVMNTNEESNTHVETSNSTIHGVEYSVDEARSQNNNSESILINDKLNIFPNKVDVHKVESSKADSDLLKPSDDDDRSHRFSFSGHEINESVSSYLPELGSGDALLPPLIGDTQDTNPYTPPTYLPDHHVNISEILNAEYEENLHLPLEGKDGFEETEGGGYLPLNQEGNSYLPTDQEGGNSYLPTDQEGGNSYLPTDQEEEWNFTGDDKETLEPPHNTNHSTQTRVETSYHVEYSDSVDHSSAHSLNVHEKDSRQSMKGDPPMNERKSHLESTGKNNLHDPSKGILIQLKRIIFRALEA